MVEDAEVDLGQEHDGDLGDNTDNDPLYPLDDNQKPSDSVFCWIRPYIAWIGREQQLPGRGQGRVSRSGGRGRFSRAASACEKKGRLWSQRDADQ